MKAVYLFIVAVIAVVMLTQPEPSEGGILDGSVTPGSDLLQNVEFRARTPGYVPGNIPQDVADAISKAMWPISKEIITIIKEMFVYSTLIKIIDVEQLPVVGEQLILVEIILQDEDGNPIVCNLLISLDDQEVKSGTCNPDVPLPEGVCYLPPDHGPCFAHFRKWFYNDTSGHCEQFDYGGCQGNANNFDSERECNRQCVCSQSKEPGMCYAAKRRWYFNNNTKTCEEFTYGGCGGNGNNFLTRDQCLQSC